MFTVCYMATHMAKQLPATSDPTHLLQIYTSTKPATTYLTFSPKPINNSLLSFSAASATL